MKNLILIFILFIMVGCRENKQSADKFISVDVTAKYPEKELVLQDFMDVEYIPLETNDEFICQGLVMAIGKDIILARNYINDGVLFVFDRKTGKGIKKINRKGQGGEEYTFIQRVVLDEDKKEIFIHDHFAKKIVVYDLDGNFKRSLKHDDDLYFAHIYDFDRDNLICNNYWVTDRESFMIVSKQDGSIIQKIQIPFDRKILMDVSTKDESKNMTYSVVPRTYYPIISTPNGYVLVEQSSDTVYQYHFDHSIVPILVRTPVIRSMDPEVFLFLSIITDHYYFMETVKKEYDFSSGSGFLGKNLMYDTQKKAIFEYKVYNDDYSEKRVVNMKTTPVNKEIASWQSMEISQLITDHRKGKLKGQLMEIASQLDEESNPVIMLIKHKK